MQWGFQIQLLIGTCSIYFLYNAASTFVYPVKDYIGDFGCYVVDIVLLYAIPLNYSMSFYTSLFRYLCLVHGNKVVAWGLTQKVRSQI